MTNTMKTGEYKSTSWNKNVNGAQKKMIAVNAADLHSKGDRPGLTGRGRQMQPSNRDTYQ